MNIVVVVNCSSLPCVDNGEVRCELHKSVLVSFQLVEAVFSVGFVHV